MFFDAINHIIVLRDYVSIYNQNGLCISPCKTVHLRVIEQVKSFAHKYRSGVFFTKTNRSLVLATDTIVIHIWRHTRYLSMATIPSGIYLR